MQDSNLRPIAYKAIALPTELIRHSAVLHHAEDGSRPTAQDIVFGSLGILISGTSAPCEPFYIMLRMDYLQPLGDLLAVEQ